MGRKAAGRVGNGVCVAADADRAAALLLGLGWRRVGDAGGLGFVAHDGLRVRVVTDARAFGVRVADARRIYLCPDAEVLGAAVMREIDARRREGGIAVVSIGLDAEPERTMVGPGFVRQAVLQPDRGPIDGQKRIGLVADTVEHDGLRVSVMRRRMVADDLQRCGDLDARDVAACRWFAALAEVIDRAGSAKAVTLDGVGGGSDPSTSAAVRSVQASAAARSQLGAAAVLLNADSLLSYVARAALVEGLTMQAIADRPSRWRGKLHNRQMVKGVVLAAVEIIERAAPKTLDGA